MAQKKGAKKIKRVLKKKIAKSRKKVAVKKNKIAAASKKIFSIMKPVRTPQRAGSVASKPAHIPPARAAKQSVAGGPIAESVAPARIPHTAGSEAGGGKDLILGESVHRTKVRVIGIGGGGGSIVSEISSRVKKSDFVIANTDSRSLKGIRNAKKFQFGFGLTKGLGTGMNPQIGEMAAQNDKEKIKNLLEGQDLCIVIACLGGGTSGGATPVFAKILKSLGCITYGIFTLPFKFEGDRKMEIAKDALLKIKPYLNAYSVIPNEKIFNIIDKNAPLKEALSSINSKLAENLAGLLEMVYSPGLINIDFADLKSILSGYGKLVYLNSIESDEQNKSEVIKKLVSSLLYPYGVKGAKGLLYNIVGGDRLKLLEVSQISEAIFQLGNRNAKIIFGVSQSHKKTDKIKVVLLATGCQAKGILPELKTKKKPIPAVKKIPAVLKKLAVEKAVKNIKLVSKAVGIKEKKAVEPLKPKQNSKASPAYPRFQRGAAGEPAYAPLRTDLQRDKAEIIPIQRQAENKNSLQIKPAIYYGEDGKIRRSALQLKKVLEEEEKEMKEREDFLETPAILRKKEQS